LASRSVNGLRDRREDAEPHRQRHGDAGGVAGQEHRVDEARRQLVDDDALVGQRLAEVAVQDAQQPGQVAQVSRLIEAQFGAENL